MSKICPVGRKLGSNGAAQVVLLLFSGTTKIPFFFAEIYVLEHQEFMRWTEKSYHLVVWGDFFRKSTFYHQEFIFSGKFFFPHFRWKGVWD